MHAHARCALYPHQCFGLSLAYASGVSQQKACWHCMCLLDFCTTLRCGFHITFPTGAMQQQVYTEINTYKRLKQGQHVALAAS